MEVGEFARAVVGVVDTVVGVVGILGGMADADAGGLADAAAAGTAGAVGGAPAAPGYRTVFEGSVEVEFDLSDGTGFGDKVAGFRGSAGAGLIRVRGGLPEDIPLWVLLLSRTR
jgi:hypothetical protein